MSDRYEEALAVFYPEGIPRAHYAAVCNMIKWATRGSDPAPPEAREVKQWRKLSWSERKAQERDEIKRRLSPLLREAVQSVKAGHGELAQLLGYSAAQFDHYVERRHLCRDHERMTEIARTIIRHAERIGGPFALTADARRALIDRDASALEDVLYREYLQRGGQNER